MLFYIWVAVASQWFGNPLYAQTLGLTRESAAQSQELRKIAEIRTRGNAKVESEAILTIVDTKVGKQLDLAGIANDIRKLHELGYFSQVRVFQESIPSGLRVTFEVEEKPAITEISYQGMEEITEKDVLDKIQTKLFTIVNETVIAEDVDLIRKQYVEKGFYLVNVSYRLEKQGKNEVKLVFVVDEGGKVKVGEVIIIGNKYFSDADIVSKFASRPYNRSQALGSAAVFQDELLKRDLEFLSFYYKDHGFAKVKVGNALTEMDTDRRFVRMTFRVEEGLQYNIGEIDVSGDVLFPKEELIEQMALKTGETFRYSRFSKDVEKLVDKYGDLGYAYADINPLTRFDDEKKTVDINYKISKGEKVYFGNMVIVGNTKTRDNVIRREFEVHGSELYSGTGMSNTKKNISRLGFFEEVQIIRKRDTDSARTMNLKVQVREKPTGQLQAAIGLSPQTKSDNKVFGQGRYDEKNQSGKGWKVNASGKWNTKDNFSLETGFTNPRVDDSQWSLGFGLFYRQKEIFYIQDSDVLEKSWGGSVKLGRRIYELIRGAVRYSLSRSVLESEEYLLPRFRNDGISSGLTFSLYRNNTDNFLDPSEGSFVELGQSFVGGALGGDLDYGETQFEASYFWPLDFTDTYRTYFKFKGLFSSIYPITDEPVPFQKRYRLGGFGDLRGFDNYSIGPKISVLMDPASGSTSIDKGGDKKFVFQTEYFIPVLPEAGIKSLVFFDMGRVYDNGESLEWSGFYKDVGFGFRWQTPIAPFRFEWAYPIEQDGSLGDVEVIFYIGYD